MAQLVSLRPEGEGFLRSSLHLAAGVDWKEAGNFIQDRVHDSPDLGLNVPFFEHRGENGPYLNVGGSGFYEHDLTLHQSGETRSSLSLAVGGFFELGSHSSAVGGLASAQLGVEDLLGTVDLSLRGYASAEAGAYQQFSSAIDQQQLGGRFRVGGLFEAGAGNEWTRFSLGVGVEADYNTVTPELNNVRGVLAPGGPYLAPAVFLGLASLVFPF
jgi:hypothetical protein